MLNRKKVGRYLGEEKPANRDRAYNTKEIQQVLTKCDERMRVIVLLLTSTGLRIGALPSLKLRNLMKIGTDSDEKCYVYQITVYEGTKEEYFCFCSPECVMAIESYLEYRRRLGEKLTSETQLIREQFDRNDLFRVRNPHKISLYTLLGILTAVLVSSGVRTVVPDTENKDRGKRREVARAHGFRKFTTTNMIRARVNPEIREMLLGHSIGLSGSYYRPDSREMLQEYLKAVDLLTISDENRLRIKVDELTTKTKDDDYIIKTKLEEKDKEVHDLKDHMATMQQAQKELLDLLKNPNKLLAVLKKE
jgi:integrase